METQVGANTPAAGDLSASANGSTAVIAAAVSAMPPANIQIRNVDMSEEMQDKAIFLAREACANEHSLRDIAGHVKREFDKCYGPMWHCVVGKSFGSFVTHETHCFIFFYVDQLGIMLFKTA